MSGGELTLGPLAIEKGDCTKLMPPIVRASLPQGLQFRFRAKRKGLIRRMGGWPQSERDQDA